ncbi:MAG: hypothetical protein QM766_19850 [Burkholderiaceae bacterium]
MQQPAIHHFDGVPFIADPYRAGSYLREDVFWRQFTITCQGEVEYLEDDPTYGTFWRSCTLEIGRCGLIEQAMTQAEQCLAEHRFDLTDDDEALRFRPEQFVVVDRSQRLVLSGEVRTRGIRWCPPVTSDQEAEEVTKAARALYDEACDEHGWDNYSTAQRLRLRAAVLQGRLVDRFWRVPGRKAIERHVPS